MGPSPLSSPTGTASGWVDGLGRRSPNKALELAVALTQHHDAITGTEKQHVANDYHRRLYAGEPAALAVMLTDSMASDAQLGYFPWQHPRSHKRWGLALHVAHRQGCLQPCPAARTSLGGTHACLLPFCKADDLHNWCLLAGMEEAGAAFAASLASMVYGAASAVPSSVFQAFFIRATQLQVRGLPRLAHLTSAVRICEQTLQHRRSICTGASG